MRKSVLFCLMWMPFVALCQLTPGFQVGILSGINTNTTQDQYPNFKLGEQVGIRIKAPIKKYFNCQAKSTLRNMNFPSFELFRTEPVDGFPIIDSREVVDNFQTIDYSFSLGLTIMRFQSFSMGVSAGAGRGMILNTEDHEMNARLLGLTPYFGLVEFGLDFQFVVSDNLHVILHIQNFNTRLYEQEYGTNSSYQANVNFSYAFNFKHQE